MRVEKAAKATRSRAKWKREIEAADRKKKREKEAADRKKAELKERREQFAKWMMKNYPEQRDKWDTMQFACKSLVASMYGVAGDAKFGLYHPEVAAAITHTSRETLNELKVICEESDCEVIYGHTDSVFVKMPDPEEGLALNRHVNKLMSPIECEFEKFCNSGQRVFSVNFEIKLSYSHFNLAFLSPDSYVACRGRLQNKTVFKIGDESLRNSPTLHHHFK